MLVVGIPEFLPVMADLGIIVLQVSIIVPDVGPVVMPVFPVLRIGRCGESHHRNQ